MRRGTIAIAGALVLGIAPALAFDTGKLGQWGSLPLEDLMPLVKKSAKLQAEVKDALAQSKKNENELMCEGMRFPGQWEHLGGERVSPYKCDFGGKWLQVKASVRVTDRSGRAIEKITPAAMKNARKVSETKPTWTWTVEEPKQ